MRAYWRETIISLDLVAVLPFLQPKIKLAFWAASAHCQLIFNFSSTSIPKPFSALSQFITQSIFIVEIAAIQDLVLVLVEPYEVHMLPLMLNIITSFPSELLIA